MKKKKASTARRKARSARPHGSASWFDVTDRLPNSGDRVIAIYKGVYEHRLVTFWLDEGGNPHFGWPSEPDGKGSQPATHWHHLPEMPNTEVSDAGPVASNCNESESRRSLD